MKRKNKIALILLSLVSGTSFSDEYIMSYKSEGIKGYETGTANFAASKIAINKGESTVLSWNVSGNPKSVSISGIGDVGTTGSIPVFPSATTDYILTETDGLKTITKTVHIDVAQHFFGESSLSFTKSAIDMGQSTVLSWAVTGEPESIQITPNIGSVAKTGSVEVYPSVNTDYVLTQTVNGITQTKTAHVDVNQYIAGDITFTADKTKVIKGSPAVLSWNITNSPQTVSINNGIGVVAKSGTLSVSPTSTTDYVITQTVNGVTTTKTLHILVQDNSSCSTLHQTDPSLVDGIYSLKAPSGIVGNYTCDMTNGGWTKLANYDTTTNAAPFIKTNYTTPGLGWYTNFAGISDGVYRDRTLNFNVNEKFNWTQSRIKITSLLYFTVDGFTNTHGGAYDRTHLSGMYVDGLSFVRIDPTNSAYNHIYTITNSSSNTLGIPVNQIGVMGVGTASFDYTYSASSQINDSIKFRGMLDQSYPDEDIGFSALQIWIK